MVSTLKILALHILCACLFEGVKADQVLGISDPVFFLHHAQIDRLWTIWQKHRAAKSLENSAVSERNGSQTGAAQWELPHSLRQEPLRLYGLGEDKAVIEVMSTDNDLLCYNYPMV